MTLQDIAKLYHAANYNELNRREAQIVDGLKQAGLVTITNPIINGQATIVAK